MLDWLERISLGAVVAVILVLAILYLAFGLRSTTPAEAVQSERVSKEAFERGLTAEKKRAIEEAERKAAARTSGAPGSAPQPARPAEKLYIVVTPEIKGRVGTLNDAVNELQRAKSEIVLNPDGSVKGLRVYEFDDGFLGAKLGLEEGDILLAVDGQPIPTDPVEARALYLEYKAKLSAQRPILLDVERKGQVKRITFDIR